MIGEEVKQRVNDLIRYGLGGLGHEFISYSKDNRELICRF